MRVFFLCLIIFPVICMAEYTVENSSIKVGLCSSSSSLESDQLKSTLTELGFLYYQSTTNTASDFAAHSCQLVFYYPGSESVTGWNVEMANGRGYIQNFIGGSWQLFPDWLGTPIPAGTVTNVQAINQTEELTTFPNDLPYNISSTRGCYIYGNSQTNQLCGSPGTIQLAITTATLPIGWITVYHALSEKYLGPGRGAFIGWCCYGSLCTEPDKQLTENAVIYSAQPPHADAGGPYSGQIGQPITLNASNSTDNGTMVLFEWDINFDGTYDFSSSNPTYVYTWTQPYGGHIRVRVTDNLGCKSTSNAIVNIGNTSVELSSFGRLKCLYK